MHDFEFAKDKVLMGSERRSMIISDAEKRVTAIHEAGHALLTVLLPHADPIHKVTIIPRGMALGADAAAAGRREAQLLARLPERTRSRFCSVAASPEEITHRTASPPGAGNDLERATGPGPPHGLRVGHERRHGAADLRQEGGADLPRPRDRAAPGLQRRHGAQDRSRRSSASSPTTTRRSHAILIENKGDADQDRRCVARPRECWTPIRSSGCAAGLSLDELQPASPRPPVSRRRTQARPRAEGAGSRWCPR